MEHPHAALARQVHAVIVSADLDALAGLCTQDIVWHVGGRGPLTADHRGIEAVTGLFARTYEMANGTLSYDVSDVLASDERAVALLTVRVTYAGRPIETQAVHVCQIRAGRISEVWAYNWDQYALDDAMTEVIVRAAR